MIVNHADNGEIHSRYDDQSNHIEMTVMASGALITLGFSQGNFNELVKTMRRLSEAFDEGRHERDVQRWIDWAEENRGSPKLKEYIKSKANEIIDQRIESKHFPFTFPDAATPINNGGAHDDPEYVFDDKDPEPGTKTSRDPEVITSKLKGRKILDASTWNDEESLTLTLDEGLVDIRVVDDHLEWEVVKGETSPDKDPIRAVKEDRLGRYGTMLDFGKPEHCGEDLTPPAPGIAPGSENVDVLQASRTEMLGIEHGFVRTRLEDDLTADGWQDIEDADEELAEFDGPVHLKRSFTLWEAGQLPKHMRRRIAAALARGEGSIVWHE